MKTRMGNDQATTSTKPAVERVHPPDWVIRLVNPLVRRLVRRGRGAVLTRSRGRHNFAGGADPTTSPAAPTPPSCEPGGAGACTPS